MSKYPNAIDDSESLPYVYDEITDVTASTVNILRDSLVTIQSELGIRPSGQFSSLSDRLMNIDDIVGTDGYLASASVLVTSPSEAFQNALFIGNLESSLEFVQAGDIVPVIIKGGNSFSDLFAIKDKYNNLLLSIEYDGSMSLSDQRIKNVADPVDGYDVATKDWTLQQISDGYFQTLTLETQEDSVVDGYFDLPPSKVGILELSFYIHEFSDDGFDIGKVVTTFFNSYEGDERNVIKPSTVISEGSTDSFYFKAANLYGNLMEAVELFHFEPNKMLLRIAHNFGDVSIKWSFKLKIINSFNIATIPLIIDPGGGFEEL